MDTDYYDNKTTFKCIKMNKSLSIETRFGVCLVAVWSNFHFLFKFPLWKLRSGQACTFGEFQAKIRMEAKSLK